MQAVFPTNLFKLACVVVLGDLSGVSNFGAQFEARVGDIVTARSPAIPCLHAPDQAVHTIVYTFSPFALPQPGDYHLRVTLEVGSVSRAFGKRLRVSAASPGPSAPSTN